jgi:hypothetical protein
MQNPIVVPLLAAACFCLTPKNMLAQEAQENYLPRCGGQFDLCGYVDRNTDAELIPYQFERAFEFSEGLAAVRIEGSFGFIDLNGNVVIEPEFDLAGEFYLGLAEVLVGDVVGVIDRSGQFVVEPQFGRAIPFTADTLIVAEGNWRNGYYAGYERLEGLSGSPYTGGRPVGLYHIAKGWVTEPKFSISLFDEPSRGLIWATTEDQYSGPFGLLRADGTWQVEPVYTHVQSLSEVGRAVVRGPSPDRVYEYNGREIDPSGVVDRDGNLVIPLEFNFLLSWGSLYAPATDRDGRQGLVGIDGTLLGGRYFDEVGISEWGSPRVREGETWYSIEPSGDLVADQNEGAVIASCPSGLIIREVSGLAQFSHPNLEAPIDLLFDRKGRFYLVDCENPIPVSINGMWGYVSQEGVVLTNPPSFDNLWEFLGGFAAVSVDGVWGIIDETGEFIVEPTYDELRREDDLYRVSKDGHEFWIDGRGNEVPEPLPTAEDRAEYLDCQDGSRLFAENDLWGMMGAGGTVLIAPDYRALTCFSQGVAWGAADGAVSWCPVGPDGQARTKPECRETHYPYIMSDSYPEPFSDDPFWSSVLWVRAYLDFGRGQRDTPPNWRTMFAAPF